MDDIAFNPTATTLVNVLTCEPSDQDSLLGLLRGNTDRVVSTLNGWISTSLLAAADGSRIAGATSSLLSFRPHRSLPDAANDLRADPRDDTHQTIGGAVAAARFPTSALHQVSIAGFGSLLAGAPALNMPCLVFANTMAN